MCLAYIYIYIIKQANERPYKCFCIFRLGHGDLVPDNPTLVPSRVETFYKLRTKVISVSCGAEHTVALTHQGVSLK